MLRRIGCDDVSIGVTGATTLDGPAMGAGNPIVAGEVTEICVDTSTDARGRFGMVDCVGVVGAEA